MTEKLFYFRGQDGAEVTLPVSPEFYDWSYGKRVETVVLTELGEVNRPGVGTLHKGTISCMFPARPYSFAKPGAGTDPMHYVGIFRGWAASREPVRYIVANGGINALVLVEDIKWKVQDASGDVYATIYLAEYIDPEAPEVSNLGTVSTGNLYRPSENDGTARQYTIVKGDTLSAICRRYYGKSTAAYYNALAKYNGIKNPHLIYPGNTITVPPESTLLGG